MLTSTALFAREGLPPRPWTNAQIELSSQSDDNVGYVDSAYSTGTLISCATP